MIDILNQLSEPYVVSQFYACSHNVKYKASTNRYIGACPICREGKSWAKKTRCYYTPAKNHIQCFNCGWSSTPLRWLERVTGDSASSIIAESQNFITDITKTTSNKPIAIKIKNFDVPDYFIEAAPSTIPIVQRGYEYLQKRGITTAVNRPKCFYVSVSQHLHEHKNRIIIPYFDMTGMRLLHYQSRDILGGEIRYLTKEDSMPTIFNVDSIDARHPYIFVNEGPFNCCFMDNGVAVGGIQENSKTLFNPAQEAQIGQFFTNKIIWVLDSQWKDKASYKKSKILLEQGQAVFIWPKNIGQLFKDINDLCSKLKQNHISTKFLLNNTFEGAEGIIKLSFIPKPT